MKYTKITAMLLSLTMLCSCTNSESITAGDTAETAEPESSAAETFEQASSDTETAPAEHEETAETSEPAAVGSELPRMDGSTSATPLEIG
ncbi:MAG: hypothetical protein K2O14_10735, partial [Oscillospiraceae bacterium]|nr:hypothetical protein [Oscillospiraceae bacterium]